jgi:hypothetical protein
MGTRLGASRETNRPVPRLSAITAAGGAVSTMRGDQGALSCTVGLQRYRVFELLSLLYILEAASGSHASGGCGGSQGGGMNHQQQIGTCPSLLGKR